eukprot:gene6153-7404_t
MINADCWLYCRLSLGTVFLPIRTQSGTIIRYVGVQNVLMTTPTQRKILQLLAHEDPEKAQE